MGFRIRVLAWALLVAAAAGAWVQADSVEETGVASRLTQDASELLDRLLGHGKAKVLVTVEGESSEVQTETETVTPVKRADAASQGDCPLPGYCKAPAGSVQKDLKKTSRRPSFTIGRIHVSVVLDQSVPEDLGNTARRLLLQVLRLDTQRGDDLVIVRTRLQTSSWRTLWSTPEGVRALLLAGLACVLVFVLLFSAHGIAARLTDALAAGRAERRAAPLPAVSGVGEEARPLPAGGADLLTGGLPTLEETGIPPMGQAPVAALGHRFDFLSSVEPAEMAVLAAKEPPQDLALLFASLAESHPDLASRLFSLLPAALQGEVSRLLVKLDMADPERLAMLESRLRTSVEFAVQGPDRLGRILSRLPPAEREGLLGDLMDREPQAAEALRRALFPFESIAGLAREELRRLALEVPREDWGAALRTAETDLVEKVLSELPEESRGAIREAMRVQQPKEKVMEARSRIMSQALALAAKGRIGLGPGGGPAEPL